MNQLESPHETAQDTTRCQTDATDATHAEETMNAIIRHQESPPDEEQEAELRDVADRAGCAYFVVAYTLPDVFQVIPGNANARSLLPGPILLHTQADYLDFLNHILHHTRRPSIGLFRG